MIKDKTSENSSGSELNLMEPHFDDERTISSAKPVVPLELVAKERQRRRWMFVGAFVIASLLGSLVALALVRLQQPNVLDSPSSEITAQQTEHTGTRRTGGDTELTEAEPLQEFFEETNEQIGSDLPLEYSRPKRRINNNRRTTTPTVTNTIKPNSEPVDPQPRLIDSWMERRQRRVNRRSDNHHSSDLFRIREIFEGPRRPRPNQPE